MFAWFQRLLPHKGDFFGMFEAHAATLVGAAEALERAGRRRHSRTSEHIGDIHRREHEADDIIRDVLTDRPPDLPDAFRPRRDHLADWRDGRCDRRNAGTRRGRSTSMSCASFAPEMKQIVALIAEAAQVTAEAMPLLRDMSRNGAQLHQLTEQAGQP